MKRRILAIVLAALMLTALLAACGGGDSKYVGKYTLSKMSIDGEEWDLAEFAELMDSDLETIQNMFTVELKSGGKATMNFGDDEPEEVTWKVDGEKITFSAGGESLEAVIKGNVITIDEDGSVMEYTKVK